MQSNLQECQMQKVSTAHHRMSIVKDDNTDKLLAKCQKPLSYKIIGNYNGQVYEILTLSPLLSVIPTA